MTSVQSKILDICLYLDEFCRENDIRYYLMGGSALGAMRHNGFIPWDDDLDVFMEYSDYVRFIELARTKLDTKHFYLQEENTEEWPGLFSKLRMNGTTYIEKGFSLPKNAHQGIFIDIMCLYNTPSKKFLRWFQYCIGRVIVAKSQLKKNYQTNSIFKKFIMKSAHILITDNMQKWLKRNIFEYWQKKDTELVGHFFGRAPFSKTSFPRVWLGKPRYVNFENHLLPVQSEVEKYLNLRYGDYMKMPDEKTKNKYPSHGLIVDTDNDYKMYINQPNN